MNGIINEGNDTIVKRTLIPSFTRKSKFKKQLNDVIDVVFVRKTKVITDALNDHLCPKKWFNFSSIIYGEAKEIGPNEENNVKNKAIFKREINGIGSKNNTTIKIVYERAYENPSEQKNDYYDIMCCLVRKAKKYQCNQQSTTEQ